MTQLPSDPPATSKASRAKLQMPSFWLYYLFQPLVLATVSMFFLEWRGTPTLADVMVAYVFQICLYYVLGWCGSPLWYLAYRLMARWFFSGGGFTAVLLRWLAYSFLGIPPAFSTFLPLLALSGEIAEPEELLRLLHLTSIASVVGATIITVFECLAVLRFKLAARR